MMISDPQSPNCIRSGIKRWFLSDTELHEGVITLQLGARESHDEVSIVSVGFKCSEGPAGFQESFFLQIYLCQGFSRQTIGIFLLLANGRSLADVVWELHKDVHLEQRNRASITLLSGGVLSAALKNRVRDNDLVFAIDSDLTWFKPFFPNTKRCSRERCYRRLLGKTHREPEV